MIEPYAFDTCCDRCLHRAYLLELCAGGIDLAWKQRRPIRDVLALDEPDLIDAVGGRGAEVLRGHADELDVVEMREEAQAAGLDVVCRHHTGFPGRLLDERSGPDALFVLARGERGRDRLRRLAGDLLGEAPPAVAIVGTRKASPEGLEVARALGRGLAAAGVTVVSGMALGIDSAAHTGALEGGGRTIAVLAGGADAPYPRSKARLHAAIAETGAVVSEMPPCFTGYRWSFPARNRVIAALAQATIVVEAAERSGSLITAEMALDLGRDVGAVPGPVGSWRSAGTNALLRDGATLIRHAGDALDLALGVAAEVERALAAPAAPPAGLAPELAALLAAVEDGRDTVAALTPDPAGAAAVRAGLMELELLGLVRRAPGGRVVRASLGTTIGAP